MPDHSVDTNKKVSRADVERIQADWVGRTIWPGSDGETILRLCDALIAAWDREEAQAALDQLHEVKEKV